jgi:hypothetical protein
MIIISLNVDYSDVLLTFDAGTKIYKWKFIFCYFCYFVIFCYFCYLFLLLRVEKLAIIDSERGCFLQTAFPAAAVTRSK